MVKQCKCCGKEFVATDVRTLYCSDKCRNKEHHRYRYQKRPLLEIICPNCGKKFKQGTVGQKYCCKKCGQVYRMKTIIPIEKPKRKENELARINRLAREHGMSYGEYVVRMKI